MRPSNSGGSSPVLRFFVRAVVIGGLAMGAVVTAEHTAAAQEVVVAVAPPAERVEVVGRAPSTHHFWMPGYWSWAGGRHVWVGGRWELNRPGWGWQRDTWVHEGRGWRFAPCRWVRR
jgi:hypothetical protein